MPWPQTQLDQDIPDADAAWALAVDRKPSLGSRMETEAVARCRVVKLDGEEAECAVLFDGYELPRVSFPTWVLKHKGLGIGSRFHWIMRGDGRIRMGDIDSDVPQSDELTAAENEELDELERAYLRRRQADCGEWSEHTGDGR